MLLNLREGRHHELQRQGELLKLESQLWGMWDLPLKPLVFLGDSGPRGKMLLVLSRSLSQILFIFLSVFFFLFTFAFVGNLNWFVFSCRLWRLLWLCKKLDVSQLFWNVCPHLWLLQLRLLFKFLPLALELDPSAVARLIFSRFIVNPDNGTELFPFYFILK